MNDSSDVALSKHVQDRHRTENGWYTPNIIKDIAETAKRGS